MADILAPIPAPPKSQSDTPFYLDKSLYVTVLGFLLPFLGKWVGVELDPVKTAGILLLAVGFVVSHKIKSGSVLVAEIKAKALATVTASAPTTPEGAAAAINSLLGGK